MHVHRMPLILFYKHLLTINWNWIRKILYWILLWLIVGIITPLLFPSVAHFFIDSLGKIFRQILGNQEFTRELSTVWIIFNQNACASLIILFLGIILGIVPRLSTAFNAFIVGIVLTTAFEKNLLSGLLFIAILIPHGIFEIPALIISAAFGIRFGWFWKNNEPRLSLKEKFIVVLKQNLQLVPLIIFLLIIAAFMEVFVSGYISEMLASYIKITTLR
jgi:stage II sporulation protein M